MERRELERGSVDLEHVTGLLGEVELTTHSLEHATPDPVPPSLHTDTLPPPHPSSVPTAPEPVLYSVDIEIISDATYLMITTGADFVKKSKTGFRGSMGMEVSRFVKVSKDLRYLFWTDKEKGGVKSKYIPLACFDNVSVTDTKGTILTESSPSDTACCISLMPRECSFGSVFSMGNFRKSVSGGSGNAMLYLPTTEDMRAWADGIRTCIENARRKFYLDYDVATELR